MEEELVELRNYVTGWGSLIMEYLSHKAGDTGWAISFGLVACWMGALLFFRPLKGFWARVWKR